MSSHVFSKAVGCSGRVDQKEGWDREHKLWEMCSGEVLGNMVLSEQRDAGAVMAASTKCGDSILELM